MTELNFKRMFFRLYDKKIGDGTVIFSQLGISKSDFTKLCTEDDFCLDRDTLERISAAMRLTDKEERELFEAAEKLGKDE